MSGVVIQVRVPIGEHGTGERGVVVYTFAGAEGGFDIIAGTKDVTDRSNGPDAVEEYERDPSQDHWSLSFNGKGIPTRAVEPA